MKRIGIVGLITVLMVTIVLAGSSAAAAGNFPDKGIYVIVPWAAGGITDRVSRAFAPALEKNLGVPVTVVNKDGASGVIGTEYVYSQDSDGYTLLFSAETPALFQVMGTCNLNFHDFEPLKMIVQDTRLIVVPGDSPYTTFQDLVDDIKARPGKVKLSYSGPGASGHILGLLLGEAGLDVSATPFGGGGPAMLATISGQVDFTFGNYGTVKDYLETGELKALAVVSNEKSEILPELPEITSVLPELEKYLPMHFPNCFLVKKGTPQEIKDILIEAINKATVEPAWVEFVNEQSYITLYDMTPDDISAYWDKFTSITAWLLYDSGVTQNNPEDFGIARYTN